MNFAIIFLCLLFGAIVGFEFGKYQATKRIQEALNKLADSMREEAQRKKEEQQERWDHFRDTLNQIAKDIEEQQKLKEPIEDPPSKPTRKRKPKAEVLKEEENQNEKCD
jgi:type VI protein secretion system component VasK